MYQACGTKATSTRDVCGSYSRGTMRCVSAIATAFLLLGIGCGKGGASRNAIGGDVRLDGKPLEKGSIQFTPIKDTRGPVSGGAIENGRYHIARAVGPVKGWYCVKISATRKTGTMAPASYAMPGKSRMVEEDGEAVAPRFNSATTLTVEIKPGANTANFEVQSK